MATRKEELHLLIESLTEDQAAGLLGELRTRADGEARPGFWEGFIGSGASGRSDLSQRYKELRQAEFGR